MRDPDNKARRHSIHPDFLQEIQESVMPDVGRRAGLAWAEEPPLSSLSVDLEEVALTYPITNQVHLSCGDPRHDGVDIVVFGHESGRALASTPNVAIGADGKPLPRNACMTVPPSYPVDPDANKLDWARFVAWITRPTETGRISDQGNYWTSTHSQRVETIYKNRGWWSDNGYPRSLYDCRWPMTAGVCWKYVVQCPHCKKNVKMRADRFELLLTALVGKGTENITFDLAKKAAQHLAQTSKTPPAHLAQRAASAYASNHRKH